MQRMTARHHISVQASQGEWNDRAKPQADTRHLLHPKLSAACPGAISAFLNGKGADGVGPPAVPVPASYRSQPDKRLFQTDRCGLGAAAAVERAARVEELDRGHARPAFAIQHDVLMDLLRSRLDRRRPVGAEQDQGV
jgi:hypothetical protein